MKKEIKFRAWNKNDNSFTYFDLNDQVEPMGREVMQFTSLKDKNGKEIYEGDIVKIAFQDDWCWEKGDTKKHQNAGRIVGVSEVKRTTKGMMKFYVSPNDPWYVHEVIGNIYENPNLLTP